MLGAVGEIKERYRIIGRGIELSNALMAVQASRHILFEGPVGVGKTVLAFSLARHFNRGFYRVDGDERYTEHKLAGWFDPSSVIVKGYSWETFIPGPLTQAMTEGAFLFINELNRMPEGTQNVLLPAMDEGRISIPRLGAVEARRGFLIIATQNPEEYVGTSRVGEALRDRFVWIPLRYQPEDEEAAIVRKETGCRDDRLVGTAVRIARRTREVPDIRRGASVRGAIDLVAMLTDQPDGSLDDPEVWVRAATMALGTKLELRERAEKAVPEIIRSIVLHALMDEKGRNTIPFETARRDGGDGGDGTARSAPEDFTKALRSRDVLGLLNFFQKSPWSIKEALFERENFDAILSVVEEASAKMLGAELLMTIQRELGPAQRNRVRAFLTRMIMQLASQVAGEVVRPTKYVEAPFRPGLEDLDIERTLDNLSAGEAVRPEDMVFRERVRKGSATVLLLDVSNSMQREKIVIATLAVGVLARKLRGDHYAVVAFKDDARVLKPMREPPSDDRLVDRFLDVEFGGSTDIRLALDVGLRELDLVEAAVKSGVLVTDGWVTKGGDPAEVASRYPKLHVIEVPMGVGGGDPETCARLAMAGGGRHFHVRDFSDLPRALLRSLRET